jgi:hypothetical protein
MTCKNVDIVAIAVILLGVALYSTAHKAVPVVVSHKRIVITAPPYPVIRVPKPPRIPLAFE